MFDFYFLKPRRTSLRPRAPSQALTFVGLTDHFDASTCLFLHTFQLDGLFAECCAAPSSAIQRPGARTRAPERGLRGAAAPAEAPTAALRCSLLGLRAAANSAAERSRGPYLDAYLADAALLAAL